ncbi:formin-like protein 20 isoform X2 [Oxyura jamaicensis]|uniref:formin-like protein 20 isoform X2 n=1 Tax=Oxyura jamaicensis TaxID=8884 RepID=UPI0015A68C0E|nr:formin-like protein 20 isoform X2 [Oxyura jamaicensis]
MLGGPERGVGRLRICERTKLLLVEINTVSCCSPAAGMAAGCPPASPWTYRSFAGEYAYLEKRLVAELAPPWPPVPRGCPAATPCPPQDFTYRPPPGHETRPWPPPARCTPEGSGCSSPRGRHPPVPPRNPVPGGKLGPPSYETHMRRMQAAHVRRGGPPPYISPPAYDAPHRTLQPRPRSSPWGPRSPPPAPRGRGAVLGGWSHTLPRAATEVGSRRPRGLQTPPGGVGPPRHSQTLPRAAASRERVPGRSGGRRGPGGHVLIDATRVVVRAQYVPPPQRQQVRYAGESPGPAAPPGSPPASPGTRSPPAAPSPPRQLPCSPRGPKQSPGTSGGPRGRPPPRDGRRCTPRRCGRPCPASGGTRRPTPTRRPRGGPGGAGGGRAATPSPTAAAAAAWRAPEPPPGAASPTRA